MNFTEKNLNAFKRDMEEAFKKLEGKYSVEIIESSITCCGYNNFNMRLNVFKINKYKQNERERFAERCALHCFTPEDYGVKIVVENKLYEIVGFRERAYKYPIVLRSIKTGKLHRMDHMTVWSALETAKKERCHTS